MTLILQLIFLTSFYYMRKSKDKENGNTFFLAETKQADIYNILEHTEVSEGPSSKHTHYKLQFRSA